jgi:hypothetical protein
MRNSFDSDKYQNRRTELLFHLEIARINAHEAGPQTTHIIEMMGTFLSVTHECISFLDEQLSQAKLYYTELHKRTLLLEKGLRGALDWHPALRGENNLIVR